MKTKPHKNPNLPLNITGWYGTWIASFPEGEQQLQTFQQFKIFQCGTTLRCVQRTDTEFLPCGATRWQLNLTNMKGVGFLESFGDMVDSDNGMPLLNGTVVPLRIGVIDQDRICVHFGTKQHVVFTRDTNQY